MPPFARRGPSGVGSPASLLLLRHSDFPPPIADHSWSLVVYYRRNSSAGDGGTSQVPGEPQCTHALALDPGGTSGAGLRDRQSLRVAPSVLPSAYTSASAPATAAYFGAQSHGLLARCLRFALAVADAYARLASGWWPSLAGRDSDPLGSFERFQRFNSSRPPFPGFAWRTVKNAHAAAIEEENFERFASAAVEDKERSAASVVADLLSGNPR